MKVSDLPDLEDKISHTPARVGPELLEPVPLQRNKVLKWFSLVLTPSCAKVTLLENF